MKKENFSQPDFYHFSEDSIFLVEQAISSLKQENVSVNTVLDVCAGSGIIGLEFLKKYNQENLKVTFVEKQKEFQNHLKNNIEKFGSNSHNFKAYFKNLEMSDYKGEDLVLCNPPYFVMGRGRLPENLHKMECRFASPQFFHCLGKFFHYSAQNGARVYFLLPNNSDALNLIKEMAPGEYTIVKSKADIVVFSYKDKS